MANRDYYEVLGLKKGSTQDEIKAAYRNLARQFHPDVNKAPDATRKFNEVQQAYDVLSDDQKRKLYDQLGPNAFENVSGPQPGASARAGRTQWGGNSRSPGGAGFGSDMDEINDVFEAIFGGSGTGAHGGGFGNAHRGRAGSSRGTRGAAPREVQSEVRVPFSIVVTGGEQTLRLDANGIARTIEVRIPKGVENGQQLRVRNGGGQAIDVLLTVRTDAHPLFVRGEGAAAGKGLDLTLDLPITVAEAALGAAINVPTPWGTVELAVPAGTNSGRKMRLRAKGLHDDEGREGDLYVVVRLMAPNGPFAEAERAALHAMSSRGTPPRAGPGWP